MLNNSSVFLDYASTTPVDSRVIDVMLPYFNQSYGNSSSIHRMGQRAENALEESRHTIAKIIGATDKEIIFTSCGSESDNLALRGVAFSQKEKRAATHILISAVEHHAVSKTAIQLGELHGFDIETIPVDQYGLVDPEEVKLRLRDETAIVSIIFANNEIGSINPIHEIGKICRSHGVPFHTDAVQAAAHLPIDVNFLNVDLLSLGAHKFYGPKGVGALYIREGTPIIPAQTGGGQEFNLRAGTHNIPLIVGMSEAFILAQSDHEERNIHYSHMRDLLLSTISETIHETRITGHPSKRLPNHASFAFHNVDGNTLLMMLDAAGFACSSGSACKTGSPEPSDVLLAMGLPPEWALGSLRVTLGQQTSLEDLENFLDTLPNLVDKVRGLSETNSFITK
ncbi:MAG: cysteine desulfurase [Anaerolineales bacterium]|nr:cysteine desulfurase [Anaerolineales bacterium]